MIESTSMQIHLDTIDSTNLYAKKHASEFPRDQITCITAEEQTAGRGRQQRRWASPRGVNLYITFFFHLPVNTRDIPCLAHLISLSLAQVLSELSPKIKWPNDLLLNGKKFCGILCETTFSPQEIEIILGIGIDVNMPAELLAEIDAPATSLLVETGRSWNRHDLLKKLQTQFTQDLEKFKTHGFAPFHAKINQLLAYRGETVRIIDGEKEWVGICDSIGEDGRLALLMPNGEKRFFYSGNLRP